MSKKPKMLRNNVYEYLGLDACKILETKDEALEQNIFDIFRQRTAPRNAVTSGFQRPVPMPDNVLQTNDKFILLKVCHLGTGTCLLRIIPPTGRIGWILNRNRQVLRLVVNCKKA